MRNRMSPVRCQSATTGQQASEHCPQIIRIDITSQVQTESALADPAAGRFACTGVIVIQRLSDAGQLIRLGTNTELRD